MTVEDHLLPGEQITFHGNGRVQFGKSRYDSYLTSQRLVLYAKRGLFGRDDVVSFKLADVSSIQYQEKGLISKQGVMRFAAMGSRVDLLGPALDMKQLYQQVLGASHKGP